MKKFLSDRSVAKYLLRPTAALILSVNTSCRNETDPPQPLLNWYVFDERSGAFLQAAENCSKVSGGQYRIALVPLPADADQQREQLVRRLAAGDHDIDIIGMDVIWTAEFAEAGWLLPWPERNAVRIAEGRLPIATESASYKDKLWAVPFTANAQLLWYRKDRIHEPPQTWQDLIDKAEISGNPGILQLQGQRYEGLTVFFVSLLASAGGSVLGENGEVSLEDKPTIETLGLMKRIANSPAAPPSLATDREDQSRLAFETGNPSFMINYSFVWPSAHLNAPEIAGDMGFARWPAVDPKLPSRVSLGGINLGVAAFSRHSKLAFEAVECLASASNQITAAVKGGLPPTLDALYDNPEIKRRFPFAELLRNTLRDAVLRPKTPVYNDISLAISRTLHPMRDIDPETDSVKLRHAVQNALNSEGLL